MSRLPDEFHQDRALRDAARDVLIADIEHVKATMNGKALTSRFTGRIGGGAQDVFEVAKHHAVEQRGWLAGLIAILALWLAREPLMEIFGFAIEPDEDGSEPDNALDGDQAEADTARPSDHKTLDEDDCDPRAQDWDARDKVQTPSSDELEPLSTGESA